MPFGHKIIIHSHEATDSSVSSGACFHDCILISENETVVCNGIGYKAQTHRKKLMVPLNPRSVLSVFGTILSYILMKQQTHQCPVGYVFMITS